MQLHKNIRILTWFNFFTDFKLYAPIAIIYFARVSDSYALGMAVFSVAMVSSALFEIPTGVFSDFIGRKRTVVLGALAAVIYSIFYAIGQSFLILAVGAIFEGLSRSFYSGNNDALLYDTLDEAGEKNQYDEFLGRVSSMFQVALAVSAILGSILASWSFSLIMWISVIPQIICLMLSFSLVEPKKHSRRSGNIYQHLKEATVDFVKNEKLRLLSISSIVSYGIGEAAYLFQAAFYSTLWPIWAIGFAKTLSNVGASLSFRFSGKLIRKYSAIRMLIAGNLYNRTVGIIAAAFPTILSPVLMASTSLFHGTSSVAESTLLQKEFRDGQRATMGSLNSLAGSLFFGVVAIGLGFIADKIHPSTGLLIFQVLLLPIIWLYWKLFKADTKA